MFSWKCVKDITSYLPLAYGKLHIISTLFCGNWMIKSPPTYHEMCGLSPCADFLTIPPFFEQKLKEHPRKTRVGLTY